MDSGLVEAGCERRTGWEALEAEQAGGDAGWGQVGGSGHGLTKYQTLGISVPAQLLPFCGVVSKSQNLSGWPPPPHF